MRLSTAQQRLRREHTFYDPSFCIGDVPEKGPEIGELDKPQVFLDKHGAQ